MRARNTDSVMIRPTTPAERRKEAVFLAIAVAYSAAFWTASIFYLWRVVAG